MDYYNCNFFFFNGEQLFLESTEMESSKQHRARNVLGNSPKMGEEEEVSKLSQINRKEKKDRKGKKAYTNGKQTVKNSVMGK